MAVARRQTAEFKATVTTGLRRDGTVALITGAGRGIGAAVALRLIAEGTHVVINDLDAAALEDVAEIAGRARRNAVKVAGDITQREFPQRFVVAALQHFGRLDIVINNAGFTWDNVIHKMQDEQRQAILDVHLTAPFRILCAASTYIREAAKRERESGQVVMRKVVNVSSVSGVYGNAGLANYSSAKAGIIGLTKAMSKEWGRYNVNVNAVAFGLIGTRLTQPLHDEHAQVDVAGRSIPIGIQAGNLAAMQRMIPLGRAGTPEEAAGAICLLWLPGV